MTKPNQKVKDEFEQKFIDSSTRVGNGRNRRWSITFVQEIQGGIQSRNAVTNDIWQFIDSALTKQRKELKLKAQAIGTPDGYVNIEKLFADTPDMDLKEVLEKL